MRVVEAWVGGALVVVDAAEVGGVWLIEGVMSVALGGLHFFFVITVVECCPWVVATDGVSVGKSWLDWLGSRLMSVASGVGLPSATLIAWLVEWVIFVFGAADASFFSEVVSRFQVREA